mgnify:CR=1 FL=1
MYIFVSRGKDRNHATDHIHRSMSYLIGSGARPNVFLFPEGTDLSEENIKKTQEYVTLYEGV